MDWICIFKYPPPDNYLGYARNKQGDFIFGMITRDDTNSPLYIINGSGLRVDNLTHWSTEEVFY